MPFLRRTFPVAAAICLGVALSIGAFALVRNVERRRVSNEFRWRAHTQTEALRVSIRRYEECIYTLRDLFDSNDHLTYTEFRTVAGDLRLRHPSIETLEWAPHIPLANRAEFETTATQDAHPQFQITEGAENKPAAERPDYTPIEFIEPPSGNETEFGRDLATGPEEDAIYRARDTGHFTTSERLWLKNSPRNEYGWTFFLAVYEPGPAPQTVAERRKRFRGIVAGSLRLTVFATISKEAAEFDTMEVLMVDRTPDAASPYLISHVGGKWKTEAPPTEDAFNHSMHRVVEMPVGDRVWRISLRPSPAWLAARRTAYPYAFLAAGLALTALLASLLISSRRRARVIDALVRQRTAELRETQEELRKDIRRRDAAEQALRASEERFRAFVAQSTDAIWCYEIHPPMPTRLPTEEQISLIFQNAWMAECNDAAAQHHGFATSKEIQSNPVEHFMPPANPANVAYWRAFIASGYLLTDRESTTEDVRGARRSFQTNVTGFIDNGLLHRVWGVQRDITERKLHEEQKQEQDTRLRLAVSAAHMGTWDWDLKESRVIWSPETERIFGLEPGEFDGALATYLKFVHPDDVERIQSVVHTALERGAHSGADHEMRIIRRDGSIRWLVARGTVLRDINGQPTRMIGTVLDATEQRRAEEQRERIEKKLLETQKLESLGVLAGGIAHDFNNLLTGILGNASLARMEAPEDSAIQPCLEQIEQVAHRAAELCKQMLAYSGKGRFVVQQLDLSAVVRSTSDLLRLSINKSAVLKLSLANDLPPINADATQIRQIVMNLIINASDAISGRSGIINVSTGVVHADQAYLSETYLAPSLPEGEYVFIEVSDNGVGMSAETREKIFDPFFTTKFTGRGLGLAAVLGIVRGHKGALKVYSEQGYGSTFKLLLPRADGLSEPPKIPAREPLSQWMGIGTILIVDDEETVRTVSERMVRKMGFDVLLARDGREALEVFRANKERVSAVMLDLTMPHLDGSAAFTELRRIRPSVRVLLMSGFNEQDATHRFAGKGLSGFLQKPFEAAALREKLHAMFPEEQEVALS